MSKKCKFHFRVNDGPEQTVKILSGVYVEVVAALPAIFNLSEYPLTVEIWMPSLLPEYGPYTYYIGSAGGRVGQILDFEGHKTVVYSTE